MYAKSILLKYTALYLDAMQSQTKAAKLADDIREAHTSMIEEEMDGRKRGVTHCSLITTAALNDGNGFLAEFMRDDNAKSFGFVPSGTGYVWSGKFRMFCMSEYNGKLTVWYTRV